MIKFRKSILYSQYYFNTDNGFHSSFEMIWWNKNNIGFNTGKVFTRLWPKPGWREPYQVTISPKISKLGTLPGTKKSENWKYGNLLGTRNLTRKFRPYFLVRPRSFWPGSSCQNQEVPGKTRYFLVTTRRRPELLGFTRKFEKSSTRNRNRNLIPGRLLVPARKFGFRSYPTTYSYHH